MLAMTPAKGAVQLTLVTGLLTRGINWGYRVCSSAEQLLIVLLFTPEDTPIWAVICRISLVMEILRTRENSKFKE